MTQMSSDALAPSYDPSSFESRLYAEWEGAGVFKPRGEGTLGVEQHRAREQEHHRQPADRERRQVRCRRIAMASGHDQHDGGESDGEQRQQEAGHAPPIARDPKAEQHQLAHCRRHLSAQGRANIRDLRKE